MELISVIVAGAAAYAFGAFWYMKWAKQWIAASGIAVDPDGKPANKSVAPFVIAGIAMLIVTGMMRHVFGMAGIETIGAGLVAGFGMGAFITLPWIVTNYAYSDRPKELTLIDGGYAVFGCTIIGTVLSFF
ncbi:DUF1761 domain-containing protein [Defluviimonas sp. WL0050]|uniref:DUF1761 domain-containing protein n=1 Tax=Albidovulum litorale TaxID=2984134 RepID=A0ABT2ZNL8_9RHOB|nr:DUF1761 domain-containing protein [Defluviimonas sp. WL0050]MCV2872730.1 DUF1761 domain-containing protein [Defluviimonas sp. WL0050]